MFPIFIIINVLILTLESLKIQFIFYGRPPIDVINA